MINHNQYKTQKYHATHDQISCIFVFEYITIEF